MLLVISEVMDFIQGLGAPPKPLSTTYHDKREAHVGNEGQCRTRLAPHHWHCDTEESATPIDYSLKQCATKADQS